MEIRWQIMRGFESALQVDTENIKLRRHIEGLHHKALATQAKHDDRLKTFYNKYRQLTKVARASLGDTRQYSQAQMDSINAELSAIRSHMQKLGDLGVHTGADLKDTHAAKKALEEKVAALQGEVVSINSAKSADNERNTETVRKLRAELGDADARNESQVNEYANLQRQTDTLVQGNEKLQEEIQRLRMWAQKMEQDGLLTVAESEEQRQRLVESHESVVGTFLNENGQMRSMLDAMQAEVARLNDLLSAPVQETHFQKFVNLKKANLQLKSKLKVVLKDAEFSQANGVPNAPPTKGGKGGGSGNNNNNNSDNNNNTEAGAINPRTGKRVAPPKEVPPSLQQQVYLASLQREREEAAELQAKQDYLQLFGSQKETPQVRRASSPPAAPPGPGRTLGGLGGGGGSLSLSGRPRSQSPINDDLDNLSPRSAYASRGGTPAQYDGPGQSRQISGAGLRQGVGGGGLQIGVPLMGKETREGLAKRVNV